MILRKTFALFFVVHTLLVHFAVAAETPEQIKNRLQLNAVADYFRRSLETGSLDTAETETFKHDITDLVRAYRDLGLPYDDEFLQWWLAHELNEFKYANLSKIKHLNLDLLTMQRYLEFNEEKKWNKDDPFYIMTFLERFISNRSIRHAISATAWYIWVALGIGFGASIVGSLEYAYFAQIVNTLSGKFNVWGSRTLRWPSVYLQKIVNMNATKSKLQPWWADHLSIEEHGIGFPDQTSEDIEDNMKMFLDWWADTNNIRSGIFTGEVTSGRALITEAFHWRENHLAQLMSVFKSEANTNEIMFENRITRLLVQLPRTRHARVLDLTRRLHEANRQRWEQRMTRGTAAQVTPEMVKLSEQLEREGIERSNITYLIKKSNSLITVDEKMAAGLSLQIIQDMMYPEYNRAMPEKVRRMQTVIRRTYHIQDDMLRAHDQIVRNLRNMGLKVSKTTHPQIYNLELELFSDSFYGYLIAREVDGHRTFSLRTPDQNEIRVRFSEGFNVDEMLNKAVSITGQPAGDGNFLIKEIEVLQPSNGLMSRQLDLFLPAQHEEQRAREDGREIKIDEILEEVEHR